MIQYKLLPLTVGVELEVASRRPHRPIDEQLDEVNAHLERINSRFPSFTVIRTAPTPPLVEYTAPDDRPDTSIEKLECSTRWYSTSDYCNLDQTRSPEIISQPFNNTHSLGSIRDVVDTLESNGHELNNRCGFHVHVGIQGQEREKLEKLACFLTYFEPVFYKFTNVERRSSPFIKRLDSRVKKNLMNGELFSAWKNGYQGVGRSYRYTWFQMSSYYQHGTIEYRLMHMSYDKKLVYEWPRFLSYMTKIVLEMPSMVSWECVMTNNKGVDELASILFDFLNQGASVLGLSEEFDSAWRYFRNVSESNIRFEISIENFAQAVNAVTAPWRANILDDTSISLALAS